MALSVVEPLNPVHNVQSGLLPCFIASLVNPLYLQRLKEAFHCRVIPGIGTGAHGDLHGEIGSTLAAVPWLVGATTVLACVALV